MDAFATPRADGKLHAVTSVFGRNVPQIVEKDDVSWLE